MKLGTSGFDYRNFASGNEATVFTQFVSNRRTAQVAYLQGLTF